MRSCVHAVRLHVWYETWKTAADAAEVAVASCALSAFSFVLRTASSYVSNTTYLPSHVTIAVQRVGALAARWLRNYEKSNITLNRLLCKV